MRLRLLALAPLAALLLGAGPGDRSSRDRLAELVPAGSGDRTPAESCQTALSAAAERVLARRLDEIARGERRAAPEPFADVREACGAVEVRESASGARPALSGPCRGSGGAPGQGFDVSRATRCLRAAVAGIANDVAPHPLPPSFVVVLTDDQRWDTVDLMPHVLAEVADRGVRFTNAFVTTPICAPSRASIFSGRYAHHHGLVGKDGRFDASTSFAGRMRAGGYRTGLIGKYLSGNEGLGATVPAGWDDYYGLEWFDDANLSPMPALRINDGGRLVEIAGTEYDEATDRYRDRALDFVRSNASRPFFLFLATTAPHAPAIPAKRHVGAFADAALWRPPSWHEEKLDEKPGWVRFLAATARKQPDPKVAIARNDQLRQRQLESLLGVDDAVAALSSALEELGLTDDTVLVFASDNGHHWGEHWSWTKFSAYEESIRIPLLIRYPRLAPLARSVPDLALNIDFAPTFLALAGLPPLPDVDGTSLVPVLAGGSLGPRAFLIESPGDFITRPTEGIRTDRWKLIRTLPPGAFEELYDLERDPYELDNLASRPEQEAIRKELGERLDRLHSTGTTK